MKNTCNLCGRENLDYSESFWGADNTDIKIATCDCCQSFIPEYVTDSLSETGAISQQVKFHEEWWEESSKDELEDVLSNVKNLVNDLQKYLGPNNPENLILELGSGRGSLLRALLDKGYSAYACEPAPKLVALARQHYELTENTLFEVPGAHFLDHIVPTLSGRPHAFVLWHVLEHLENPMQLLNKLYDMLNDGGCLILQLPILCKEYIYPEHYFFPSHATFDYMAKNAGFQVEAVEYDLNYFFATVCFRKSSAIVSRAKSELTERMRNMSPLSQAIFLRDEVIHERENAVSAQTKIINEKIQGMDLMDSFIQERDKTIVAQTAIIDDNVLAINTISSMIDDRDKTLETNAALITNQAAVISSMASIISERDKTINNQIETINSKTSAIAEMKVITENTHKELNTYKESLIFKAAKFIRLIK